jgi:outer membrane protein OmpA-like peptidoglycan-associated protein
MLKSHFVRTAIALVSISLTLPSCSLFQSSRPDTGAIRYSYTIENPGLESIVQVYNLDGNTVVQFRNVHSLDIEVLDSAKGSIAYRRIGENIVLKGVQPNFTVKTQNGSAYIFDAQQVPQQAQPDDTKAPFSYSSVSLRSDTEQTFRVEIQNIKEEIASLKAELARELKKIVAAREAEKITVSFKNNTTLFSPSPSQTDYLLKLVMGVSEISIKGFTDSYIASKGAATLAEKRAKSAQQYLVRKGVNPKTISLDFSASGEFVADNKTNEGKSKNRRVEISVL